MAAQLFAMDSFPVPLKTKAIYFVKIGKVVVPKDNPSSVLIIGDMASKPIEQLATIVDDIFVPLLANPENHRNWANVVSLDVQEHVHSLKSTVYQVKGQINGQTILPMPVGVERLDSIEKTVRQSDGKIVDLHFKSAVEGVIIKWATQITEVLNADSALAFKNNQHASPWAEVAFWDCRVKNLKYIFEQLRDDRIVKMTTVVQMTNSAYYPCLKSIHANVVSALEEAEDIVRYLKPLQTYFKLLEETDFGDIAVCLSPLMHVVCLVWSNSRFYCSSSKIIVLLKQICNLLIAQAVRYLDPSSIFQSDIHETKSRVCHCITVFEKFRNTFNEYRQKLPSYFENEAKALLWTFHPNIVFNRTDLFVRRLQIIEWFFDTVVEFTKLERIEFSGLKGRLLSARVTEIYSDFNEQFSLFSSKSYDVLEPEDERFEVDYEQFKESIKDLDHRLAFTLSQAFGDCHNLDGVFKLIEIVGVVMDRSRMNDMFTNSYDRVLNMLSNEVTICKNMLETQMIAIKTQGSAIVDKLMPPIAGFLKWSKSLKARVENPTQSFKNLDHPIVQSKKAQLILKEVDDIIASLNKIETDLLENWKTTAPRKCEELLELPLFSRSNRNELQLNFHPELVAILREVRYFRSAELTNIPTEALRFYEREDTFRIYCINLNNTKECYNKLRNNSSDIEFQLVQEEIEPIDELVKRGENLLNWNSDGLNEYIGSVQDLVNKLYRRVQKTQENIKRMRSAMSSWARLPVLCRKDNKKDTLLALDDRVERFSKRRKEIERAATDIHKLLQENSVLFGMQDQTHLEQWQNYVTYIDSIVADGLLNAIGCSLCYIVENMVPGMSSAPLFEACLELQEPDLVFTPSLDSDVKGNFCSIIQGIIEEIIELSKLMSRISGKKNASDYYDEMNSNSDICGMREDIMNTVTRVVGEANNFCVNFENYSYLWLDDRELYMQHFLRYGHPLSMEEYEIMSQDDTYAPPVVSPTMEQFKEQIDNFESIYCEIEQLNSFQVFDSWFQVDTRPFKQALLNTVCKWSHMFKQHLMDNVTNSLFDLAKFIQDADGGLMQPVVEGDYKVLVSVMGYLYNVKERQATTDEMFQPLTDTIQLLKYYDMELSEEVNVLLQELPELWNNTCKLAINIKQQVAPLQAIEVNNIRNRIIYFDTRINNFREHFKKSNIFRYDCPYPYFVLNLANAKIMEFEMNMVQIQESASLFEVNVPEFKMLKQCRKELKLLKQLWDYVHLIHSCINDWKTTPWRKVDVENMDIECKKFAKEIRALDKEMRSWDTYTCLEATVKNMVTSLRAVGELQNPAIRERHWKQLMGSTKVKFVMDQSTTLAELLALNLHECEDDVKTIVDKAVKEMSMEKMLRELQTTWAAMEFYQETHGRTGCSLLRASEKLIETLEENQVQLQNLMTSKFVAFFLEEVSSWQQKLSIADQVINSWFEVQRTWMHLESIFMSSDDIRKQLPEDSERFIRIDSEFKELMNSMSKTPNVIEATNKPGLIKHLEDLHGHLTLCEKALAEYLETKRLAFPRFYFVSAADLLDILSNGNNPDQVARHMIKLFDSIASLEFIDLKTSEKKVAVGMHAKDGEYVKFNEDCDCSGPVEKWLNRIQTMMRATIRQNFLESTLSYEEKPREQWLFDYPAQVSLCGTQIWWTTEVNLAFARLEEGYENALKDYQRKQISQLNTLITLLLGELTRQDRQKIMTICTIDVHSRDVVGRLIQSKIENVLAFQWQSQLRHRWDEKEKDCFANICDAQFQYSHEYLGNTPRLVITPLTDRCYITLTQSLHLIMGGGPAGPAGTGKTETTKDLGRALGVMVYVFNCSEQMDYKSCGNIYKGLAQTGAWGCFDEFNRISVEVLSVVAVQVKSIQDAIRKKDSTFNFMGEQISLISSVGIFITMNPGYAGRTELPENLKALFRPCAMVVPDFELICEIMLVAEGFQEAKILARKFITLYTLCKELLSKQDHYDWGLRAIKSVLVVAGSLKRGDPGRIEEEVLMRALRDFNIPKIISDDVPVFMGLIGDLFPSLDVPRKRDQDFEKTVKQAAVDLLLQPEENFILKVVQLEELLEVRHSVFVVGNAGTGKTEVWKTLFKTYQNMKRKPTYNDLNPKAVTNDELFGVINPATREWKDGLFSVIMRDQANIPNVHPKWILLDGDIDPMWIESLNTVMDDNKVLTLASNERIALTPSMRLIFEISNLRTATPATVSRAGILYLNPQDLGWNP